MAHCSEKSKSNIILHAFPKDKEMQMKWTQACRRADPFKIEHSRVCSLHFLPEAYERDLQNELLNLPPRKKLKKDAIPSINLPIRRAESESKQSQVKERKSRFDARRQKKELNQILQDAQKHRNGIK